MEKTISITLAKLLFNIEEDAYERLRSYLEAIKRHYSGQEGEEITADIESSIADKFSSLMSEKKKVITLADVEGVIKIMGTVEEVAGDDQEDSAKEEPKDGAASFSGQSSSSVPKKLYRNPDDVVIAGVCSGIAAYFGIDPLFIRLFFVLLTLANGTGILVYIVLWAIMPAAGTNAQKLEMQGKPVNLKKLEETIKEKAAEMKQGLDGGQRAKSIIRRIAAFPILVIQRVAWLAKKVLGGIWPLISFICGFAIIIAAVFAIIGLSLAAGVVIFHLDSPYLISDIPLTGLAAGPAFYIFAISVYLTALVPLIFLGQFGTTWLRRKNTFRLASSTVLIGLWMAAVVGAGLSAVDIVPEINRRVDEAQELNNATRDYDFTGVKSVRLGTIGTAKVQYGPEFKLSISGDEVALDQLAMENDNGELKITQKDRSLGFARDGRRGICLFCLDRKVNVDLTLPELESFIAFRDVRAEVSGFDGRDMRVNAGEMARVTVRMASGTLTSYIAGVNGRVEVIGSPSAIDATLEGLGALNAFDLKSKSIKINASALSRVTLAGEAEELDLIIEDTARIRAASLKTKKATVQASDLGQAEIWPLDSLSARTEDNARIQYRGEPGDLDRLEEDNARIWRNDSITVREGAEVADEGTFQPEE